MSMRKTGLRIAFLASVMIVFAAAATVFFRLVGMEGPSLPPVTLMTVIFGGALAFFLFDGPDETDPLLLLLSTAVIGGLLMARFCMLPYVSNDYNAFLSNWIAALREAPGLSGLGLSVGDYNVPYLYLLFLIAKATPAHDLYYIKLISIAFDVLLAYFVMRLVRRSVRSPRAAFAAFAVTMALPTVLLNGACWGQCDSVYAALLVGCLVTALEDRPKTSCLLLALAFAFKLQTVFFLPLFLLLVLIRKIDLLSLAVIPLAFFGSLLPAILAGRDLADTLSIYLRQTDTYHYLVMNAPTVYRLFGSELNFDTMHAVGLLLAGTATAALLALLWKRRATLDDVRLSDAALLFALAMPYLLPRMHDRYFFLADVFSLVYAFHHPKRWYLPLLVVGASYTAYFHYLFGGGELIDPVYAALAMGGALVLTVRDLLRSPDNATQEA